jgi:hypothetical protein
MYVERGDDLQMAQIAANVYLLRSQYVMIDADLALLDGVATRVLNQAVQRTTERFPLPDFMFQVTEKEADSSRSRFVISKYLRSQKAVSVSISIARTFVRLRQLLSNHNELAPRLDALECRESERHGKAQHVFETIQHLIEAPQSEPKRAIGFPTARAAV